MDVILLKDVEKLGAQGAVVDVKPGFARNYLVPRGLAELAAPVPSHLRAPRAPFLRSRPGDPPGASGRVSYHAPG